MNIPKDLLGAKARLESALFGREYQNAIVKLETLAERKRQGHLFSDLEHARRFLLTNVHGLSIGFKAPKAGTRAMQPVIRIFAFDDYPRELYQRLGLMHPTELAEVETDLVCVEPPSVKSARLSSQSDQTVGPGSSISHIEELRGTLGLVCTVSGNSTDKFAISNQHVLLGEYGSVGDDVKSPAFTGPIVGEVVRVAGIEFDLSVRNSMDAGLARLNVEPRCGLPGGRQLQGKEAPRIGDPVEIVGSSSLFETGVISDVGLTTIVRYFDSQYALFDQQFIIKPKYRDFFGVAGDSGSLVVDSGDYAVGFYFAEGCYGGVATSASKVLSFFDASICQ